MTALTILGQVALQVGDTDNAETFYRDTLGLKQLYRFGELAFFDCDGTRLMLQGGRAPRTPGNTLCLYFRVPGIEHAVEDLETRGVSFEAPPQLVASMPDHELWMAFFRDPDGYLLALMEERR